MINKVGGKKDSNHLLTKVHGSLGAQVNEKVGACQKRDAVWDDYCEGRVRHWSLQ